MNTQNSQSNPNVFNNEQFDFVLSGTNRIKPKTLKKVDIQNLIRANRLSELNELLRDLSGENFEENDYFDFNRDELKLVKSYQILMQYMLYSVNHLTRKNQLLNDLAKEQLTINEKAEEVLAKQAKRIKEQEEAIGELTNNCINMEYLIKQLHLEDQVNNIGLNNIDPADKNLSPEQCENLRNKMENPQPKDLAGDP